MSILNKKRPLTKIDRNMIRNGVLKIPDNITIISGTLDEFLTQAGIKGELVEDVIFPPSLKEIDGFFCNNGTVNRAFFTMPVSVTSYYGKETFQGVKEVYIRGGFKQIDANHFYGIVQSQANYSDNNISTQRFPYGNGTTICPSFYNSILKSLIVGYDGNRQCITEVEASYLQGYVERNHYDEIKKDHLNGDITTKSWKEISHYIYYTNIDLVIFNRTIKGTIIPMSHFDDKLVEVYKKYSASKQKSIGSKPVLLVASK